jgi:hypothetical protein
MGVTEDMSDDEDQREPEPASAPLPEPKRPDPGEPETHGRKPDGVKTTETDRREREDRQ